MGIKDLFGNKILSKPIASEAIDKLAREVESSDYIDRRIEEKERFLPHVNYASASSFAKYGSAEKYYDSSIKRIYNQYPYDGSKAEIREFFNESNYLDLYLFDNKYPRTTGFINLGLTSMVHANKVEGWGYTSTTDEYIEILGGPHTSSAGMVGNPLSDAFGDPTYRTSPNANIYDADIYTTANTLADERTGSRESNLKFNLTDGLTVEFWLKKEAFIAAQTEKEVIFDLWNGTVSGSEATENAGYGRLLIYLDQAETAGNAIKFHLASGSTVWDAALGDQEYASGHFVDSTPNWYHYALSFASSSADNQLQAKLYVSGTLVDSAAADTGSFGEVTGSLKARIGALQYAPSGNSFHEQRTNFAGSSKLSASLDEFRFWKTKRTSEEIGRNWFTQVGGGTNNDISNAELGFYFKFNEGTVGSSSIDSTILDYSGRISNGSWVGYPGTTARETGSAMVISSASLSEFRDPIIYSSHPDVKNLASELRTSGSWHDEQNPASLYHSLPSFMIEEDRNSVLSEMTQIVSSYLDTLHLQVEALPRIKDASFLSASFKPVPFANRLLESHGFHAPEIFANADVLAQIANRDEKREFELDLHEVKNRIYKNIYNTLVHIYKSKGTESAFRNLIRAYGVDEELIKISLYGNNITHTINDNLKFVASKVKAINFNDRNHFGATVVQWTGSNANPNTRDTFFLSGSERMVNDGIDGNARTAEVQVIFPQKLPRDHQEWFPTPFLSASVFGTIAPLTRGVTTTGKIHNNWAVGSGPPEDRKIGDFCLYAVRPSLESKDAHFVLKDRYNHFLLSSSLYKDVYDNEKWTFGVRTRHVKYNHPIAFSHLTGGQLYATASGPTLPDDDSSRYHRTELEFYGVNTDLDIVKNEFYLTSSELLARMHDETRRYYAGAQRTDYTGSVTVHSDIKLVSLRHWESYVDNESIKFHSMDPLNYGTKNPQQATHFTNSGSLDGNWVPEMETLALHWNFANVTGSDAVGNFLVDDVSSGSVDLRTRYPTYLGELLGNQHGGLGYGFVANSTSSYDVNYIPTSRLQPPEIMNSVDMVNIADRDDNKFTRESRPINYFFAFEKSMYRTISEEMLKMFATIVEFSNLFGRPVDRYRTEYKDMRKLRSLFFERVGNTPDLEKYVSYYKWIDGALGEMLQQLVPASADASDGLRTVIESHELERNKYRHKFPNIKHVEPDFTGHIYGIEEMLYDWEYGHAPEWTAATATITVSDAGSLADGETFIIVDAEGTSHTFTIEDGDDVTTGNKVGVQTAKGASHEVNAATQFAASINNASATASTCLGKISAVANGDGTVTLTQVIKGAVGNKTNDDTSTAGFAVTNFTGGTGSEQENTLWWKDRAKRTRLEFNTSDTIDGQREIYRQTAPAHISGTGPIHAQSDKTEYTGSAYALRNFTKIYRFGTSVASPIHGGSNYGLTKPGVFNKKPDIINATLDYDSSFFNQLGIEAGSSSIEAVNDNPSPRELRKIQKYHTAIIRDLESADAYGFYRTKGSLTAPFTMYSSSVTTGYQGELGRLGHSIDLTNMHSDVYGDDYEVPMQGPFTERFVGGSQHRHVDLNRVASITDHDSAHTADTDATRPEKWTLKPNYSEGTINIQSRHRKSAASRELPRARYYRDEVSKRPVNIRNIKMSTSGTTTFVSGTLRASIGNYTRDYEIVQTSDRSVNNREFVRAEGFSTDNVTTVADALVEGLIDYAKPVRERTEHVFVERFSAPGGPETAGDNNGGPGLDVASGQFSPYNDMNSRNSTVRQPLNTLHTERSEYGAARSGTVVTTDDVWDASWKPSYHKVNRNIAKRLKLNSYKDLWDATLATDVVTASIHDNFFIQHAIPRSDTQYSWITGSLVRAYELGHISRLDGMTDVNGTTDAALTFVTGAVNGRLWAVDEKGDHSWLDDGGHYIDTVGLNKYIYEPVSASLGRLGYPLNSPNSKYMKADLGLQNALSTAEINAIPAIPTASFLNSLMHHRGNRGYPTWRQIRVGENPIVRNWRKNNLYVINTQSVSITVQENPYVTYYNVHGELVSFSEPPVVSVNYPLDYEIGVTVNGQITSTDIRGTYGNLVDYFANPDLQDKVVLCRGPEEATSECPPTHVKIRDIYKDPAVDPRPGGQNNGDGQDVMQQAVAHSMFDTNAWDNAWAQAETTVANYSQRRPKLNTLKVRQQVWPKREYTYLNKVRRREGYQNNFWRATRADRATITKWDSIIAGVVVNQTYSRWNLDEDTVFATNTIRGGQIGRDDDSGILQNNRTHCMRAATKYKEVTGSILYSRKHTLPNTGSTRGMTSPDNNTGLSDVSDLSSLTYVAPTYGNAKWQAGDQAGYYDKDGAWVSSSSDPFDDGYNNYVNDLRLINKDYSVIPEFRISDHIDYYIKKKGGNFLSDLSGALQIIGASTSGTLAQNSNNGEFYKVFSNSEFLKHFETLRSEHDEMIDPSGLTLTCKAIMKFHPYDGFYPSELLGDLYSQFSSSYFSDVKTAPTASWTSYPSMGHRPFVAPMFAPGIWCNTIKSGIAVDYPVFTGSWNIHNPLTDFKRPGTGAGAAPSGSTDFWLIGTSSNPRRDGNGALLGWDYRVPFEATVEPEKYMTNLHFYDMEPYPSASLNLTSAWGGGGDNLYKLKANNAWASMIDFFLPGPDNKGELTTFTTRPEKEFGRFKRGTTYGMRVKLRKSYNIPRQVGSRFTRGYMTPQDSFLDSTKHGLRETFTMYSRPSAFGPPVSGRGGICHLSASITSWEAIEEPDSLLGVNPSFTPPYYDGEAWADIIYTHESDFQPTIADIMTGSQLVCWRWDPQHMGVTNNSMPYGHDNINLFSMQLSHSINLFGVAKVKSMEHTADGTATKVFDDQTERSNVWTIQPKMETPMLNFNDVQYETPVYGSESVPRGMWHQFGRIPQDSDTGIFLEVGDIDPQWLKMRVPRFISSSIGRGTSFKSPGFSSRLPLGRDYTAYRDLYNQGEVESLNSLIKFNRSSARLGELAAKRTVKEAIVAVPYLQVGNKRKFFSIQKRQITAAKRVISGLGTTVSVGGSIIEMVSKMTDYVFPPRMDFLKYPKEVKPFAMYIFEFEHEFDQDDLSYIWQNIRPPSGKKIKTAKSTVSHRLLTNELMGEMAKKTNRPLQDRLRWMVFKVKQKAAWDYFEKIVEDTKFADSRYQSAFKVGRTTTATTKIKEISDYSYNWPYDNFSLVEFAKIEAEVRLSDDFSPEEENLRTGTKLKKRGDQKIRDAYTNDVNAASEPPALAGARPGGDMSGRSRSRPASGGDKLRPAAMGSPGGLRTQTYYPESSVDTTDRLVHYESLDGTIQGATTETVNTDRPAGTVQQAAAVSEDKTRAATGAPTKSKVATPKSKTAKGSDKYTSKKYKK